MVKHRNKIRDTVALTGAGIVLGSSAIVVLTLFAVTIVTTSMVAAGIMMHEKLNGKGKEKK